MTGGIPAPATQRRSCRYYMGVTTVIALAPLLFWIAVLAIGVAAVVAVCYGIFLMGRAAWRWHTRRPGRPAAGPLRPYATQAELDELKGVIAAAYGQAGMSMPEAAHSRPNLWIVRDQDVSLPEAG